MAGRKGAIAFGLVYIPVELFTATQDDAVRFNQLAKDSMKRVRYVKTCPDCKRELKPEDIVKGYQYEKGKYVVVDDEELDAIKTDADRAMKIVQFSDIDEVPPLYFEKPYQVVAQPGGEKALELLRRAMVDEGKIAIGTTMAHSYYGFSGGAKCILPGVSSLRTIMRNHSFTTTTEFNMGNPHTLMRSDAEQAARMMGLDFKIDAILNGHAQICNLCAGDFEAEIQHAAAYAAEHYAAKFVPDCDVVIANNYFKPAEANCAYTPEVIASLKDGGSFVLAANSPFGPCVHFLYDKWGHSAPGGMMWSGCYTKGKNMAHAVVFAEHTVKGMRDPWYIDEHSGAEYVKTWNDALRILDDGTPKKVVLYPNAECQVLDNSKQFYKHCK